MLRKILFLDIDGVLNNDNTESTTSNGYTFVSNSLVDNLKHIIDKTGAEIILSSDWRLPFNREDCDELKNKLAKWNLKIAGQTPFINGGLNREDEIHFWLQLNRDVNNFVILDDYFFFPNYKENFVRTNEHFGLTKEDAEKAIKILNGE